MRNMLLEVKLIIPDKSYELSYREALEEAKSDPGDDDPMLKQLEPNQSFSEFVKCKLEAIDGINIPKHHLPETTLWLVEDSQFICRITISMV